LPPLLDAISARSYGVVTPKQDDIPVCEGGRYVSAENHAASGPIRLGAVSTMVTEQAGRSNDSNQALG